MGTYQHGEIKIKRPKYVSSTQRVLIFRYSYNEETKSLRFFNLKGTPIKETTDLYSKTLKPTFERQILKA